MFKIQKITFLLALLTLGMVACENGGNKEVEYIEKGEGEALNEGDFVTYKLKLVTADDSVLVDSEEAGELPIEIQDSVIKERGRLFEILASLNVGDSILAKLTTYEVFKNGFGQSVPMNMDSAAMISMYAKPTAKYDSAGFMAWRQQQMQEMMAKRQKEMAAQKTTDEEILQKFFTDNSLTPQKTESGLYYIIDKEGNGPQAMAGDTVRVNYTGTLLNGNFFDSSYEEVAKENDRFNPQRNYEPLQFQVGKGRVIRGWDEGLTLLKEGAEATFYIPSHLAYGPQARGEDIPANSILVFDVELVEVIKSNQ